MFDDVLRVFETKDKYIEVQQDDFFPDNPRGECPITHLIFHTRRIELSDEDYKDIDYDEFSSWAEVENWIYENEDVAICWPVYMMDHTYYTLRARPFSGPFGRFDSGQVGFLWINKEELKEYFDNNTEEAKEAMSFELETLEAWMNGEIYIITERSKKDPNDYESCGGFLGSWDLEEYIKTEWPEAKEIDVDDYKEKFEIETIIKYREE